MMIFTVGFGQVEGALFLWAQDRTDRILLGFEIPAAWFVGLPALLVLLLAPAQLALLPRIQHRVSTPRLIALGPRRRRAGLRGPDSPRAPQSTVIA